MPAFLQLWPLAAAFASGVLMALCYAPWKLGGLAWVALVPILGALLIPPCLSRKMAFGLGYLFGAVFFLISLHWLVNVTFPGWILLALYLAIYPALWALFTRWIAKPSGGSRREAEWLDSWSNLGCALLSAAVWVSMEWLRAWVFTGFGWNPLGVALIDNLPMIQMAEFTGTSGISFLLVVVNVLILLTVLRLKAEIRVRRMRPHFDFSIGVALVAVAFAYGVHALLSPPPVQTPLSYVAVQPNIPIHSKLDREQAAAILQKHETLSTAARVSRPDLLIWPEAATPGPLYLDELSRTTVERLHQSLEGDFLLGSVHYDDTGDYNAAILLGPSGNAAQIYRKIHLVPFGEFVPFRDGFPLFAWAVGDLVPDDFDFGQEVVVFDLSRNGLRVAPLICFEDTLGYLVRQFARQGAQVLITLTNDAWFLESAGSEQHRDNAVMRTIETRLPMLRVANTGVTCAIDAFGRETMRLHDGGNTFIEGVMSGEIMVPVSPMPTFFTQFGELFTWLCIALTLATIIFHLLKRRVSARLPSTVSQNDAG